MCLAPFGGREERWWSKATVLCPGRRICYHECSNPNAADLAIPSERTLVSLAELISVFIIMEKACTVWSGSAERKTEQVFCSIQGLRMYYRPDSAANFRMAPHASTPTSTNPTKGLEWFLLWDLNDYIIPNICLSAINYSNNFLSLSFSHAHTEQSIFFKVAFKVTLQRGPGRA